MNKPVCSGLSILELYEILMLEFWYNYVKPKYGERERLCCMDTDSFIVHIKTNDIYRYLSLQKMLKLDLILQIMNQNAIPLVEHYLKEKNKKVIGLMKDELGGKIITKFVGLRAKHIVT